MERPAWVIDGVSAQVRHASEWVIFLDVPRPVSVWRGIRRSIQYSHRTRPELPANCPQWRIVPRLLGFIWRFLSYAGVVIARQAGHASHRYTIIKNASDLASVLAQAPATKHAVAEDLRGLRHSGAVERGVQRRQLRQRPRLHTGSKLE